MAQRHIDHSENLQSRLLELVNTDTCDVTFVVGPGVGRNTDEKPQQLERDQQQYSVPVHASFGSTVTSSELSLSPPQSPSPTSLLSLSSDVRHEVEASEESSSTSAVAAAVADCIGPPTSTTPITMSMSPLGERNGRDNPSPDAATAISGGPHGGISAGNNDDNSGARGRRPKSGGGATASPTSVTGTVGHLGTDRFSTTRFHLRSISWTFGHIVLFALVLCYQIRVSTMIHAPNISVLTLRFDFVTYGRFCCHEGPIFHLMPGLALIP